MNLIWCNSVSILLQILLWGWFICQQLPTLLIGMCYILYNCICINILSQWTTGRLKWKYQNFSVSIISVCFGLVHFGKIGKYRIEIFEFITFLVTVGNLTYHIIILTYILTTSVSYCSEAESVPDKNEN